MREPQVRIELTTARLRIGCSTPELLWQVWVLPYPKLRGGYGSFPPASLEAWNVCPGADSNRYAFRHHPLKMACLPISPPGRQPLAGRKFCELRVFFETGPTGLEPATSRVTVECSNQTELRPQLWSQGRKPLPHCHLPSRTGCQSVLFPLSSFSIAPRGIEPLSAP
jgi:hypothetical protein